MWGGGGSSWEQDMFLSGARRAPARLSGMSCCVPDTGRQGQSRNPDGGESEARGSLREARNGSVSRREGTWEPGGLPSRVETRRRCLGDHGSVRQRSYRRGRRRGLGCVWGGTEWLRRVTDILHALPACARRAGHRCEEPGDETRWPGWSQAQVPPLARSEGT